MSLRTSEPTSPAPFHAGSVTYSVPTMHFLGVARIERFNNARVVELTLRDPRYGLLLFPDNPNTTALRAATSAVLAESHPGNLYTGSPLTLLNLALPTFKIGSTYSPSIPLPKMVQNVSLTTLLDVNEDGIGRPSNWPPLPRIGYLATSTKTAVSLDHSFSFVLVRFDTRSTLIVGHVARPTLNA